MTKATITLPRKRAEVNKKKEDLNDLGLTIRDELGIASLVQLPIIHDDNSGMMSPLIRLQIHDRFEDGVGLGEDGVFQDGLVGDVGI